MSDRPRSRWRSLLRVVLVVAASLLLLEWTLRWLIFSDTELAQKLGESLRDPTYFCAHELGSEFYLIRANMAKPALAEYPCPTADPLLGWTSSEFGGERYVHVGEATLGERRPVLFYGDSFTQCVERAGNCWETLLEAHPLASSMSLLNFGVGGYGFDQTYLTCRETLPRLVERDPVVLVGLLIDDDLDRCALSLRSWPKPRFLYEGDELVLQKPHGPSAADVIAQESAGITSYLVRLLLHEGGVPNELRVKCLGRESQSEEVRAVTRGLLDRFAELFAEHEIEPLFVVFHGPELTRTGAVGWREAFFTEELEARGLAWLNAGQILRDAATQSGRSTDDYFFLDDGRGRNHLTQEGNATIFQALTPKLAGTAVSDTSFPR